MSLLARFPPLCSDNTTSESLLVAFAYQSFGCLGKGTVSHVNTSRLNLHERDPHRLNRRICIVAPPAT